MKQAIIILIKNKEIARIRGIYDTSSNKIKPHVTIAFPFSNINQKKLNNHIINSLKGIKRFKLILKGIRKSPKENYLYLLVRKGKSEILKIHKRLYSEIFIRWLRKDIPYIPHVTLGVFKTREEIDKAVKEIKQEKLNFSFRINSIQLITLNRDSSIKCIKNFNLK